MLPPAMRARLSPLLDRLLPILTGNDPRNQAQRTALIAFAIRIFSAAIAFISQIILARLMGEFEYGIFVFVWVLVVLFGNLSCLGFHTTVIRFLPQYHAMGARDEIRGLTATARIFAILAATTLACTGLLGLWLFGDLIHGYYVLPLYLAAFCLPMIALGDVLDGTARANSWPVVALSPTYIIRPLLILGFMMFAAWIGEPHTAKVAMVSALAATYITTLTQFLTVTWRLRNRFETGPRKIEFRTWLMVALPIFFIEGFSFMLTNSDVVVVGLYLEPEQVAIYFAAAKTMALVQFVIFSVKAAAAPRFSAMIDKDRSQLATIAIESARWTFWPALAVGLLMLLAGPLLLSLFGPAFISGYPLMAILFAGILSKALIGPAETLLTMAGEQKLCVYLYAMALAANISLNVTLIPLFGLTGAAVAAMGAMMVEAILLHVAIRYKFGIIVFAFSKSPAHFQPEKIA
ncbi:lipopolysaccharide biosynthesis protein [Pararhizobium sp.]|uniref:lipopolysaccharide biosynthesis protein n=1 Tax=Pararhizobium sp. TaxID=1977563 RepID=UPI00271B11A8|nr:lipopolysaccharide biosynthesis protein [Pararhizobium sp.]MDO9417918.1 lipopolysaccharide biosynthesis protein [Pararhizobium sp.]